MILHINLLLKDIAKYNIHLYILFNYYDNFRIINLTQSSIL